MTRYGVSPAFARNFQMAIVQGTLLYAAELPWNGQTAMEGEYQATINRMGRALQAPWWSGRDNEE